MDYTSLNQFKKIICPSSQDEETAICIIKYLSSEVNVNNSITHGLFNDKYFLHLIKTNEVEKKFPIFENRISYNTKNDSYYENGIIKNKYLEFWDKGAYEYDNIAYVPEYGADRIFLTRYDSNKLGHIVWKFDYSDSHQQQQEFTIFSLSLELDDAIWNSVQWFIAPLTKNNNNTNTLELNWGKIPKGSSHLLYLSDFVKGKSGFMLKAELYKGMAHLFSQRMYKSRKLKDNERIFSMDIRVKLIQSQKDSNNLLNDNLRFKVNDNDIKKNISFGLFNDKYKFNVLPNKEKENLFNHRISYNTRTDAYYENGITTKKYLKRWDRGTLDFYNIAYNAEHNWKKVYLSKEQVDRDEYENRKKGYIKWKFDYRPGNFIIKSLSLKLIQYAWHDDTIIENIKISIIPLATRQNAMLLSWKPISCDFTSGLSLYWSYNKSDSILDLSSFVKGEYGFILRVQLLGNLSWDRLQLFRQEMDKAEPLIDDDESFGMDVRVELEPNIICKELPKNIFNEKEIVLNDQNTSDFTIILNDSKENQVAYHVHKFILEYYSEYFKGLFSSQMRETADKTLTLSEISVHSFENILNFMYTGQVKDDLNDLEQWTDLLYGASRFIIPILIQECEKSISKYVNNDNVEEIEGIANDCGAEQLFRYCQMLETENSDALYLLKI